MTATRPAPPTRAELRTALFSAGLLVDSGVAGLVGQGPVFVDVRQALERLVTEAAAAEQPVSMSFPPVMPAALFRTSHYLRSFPHLAGSVWSFDGDDAAAGSQAELAETGGDWSGYQRMTDLVLVPAACHPVYPAVGAGGPVPVEGMTIDAGAAFVFRHEPSDDPARLQSFRQRELVRIGGAESVTRWRAEWIDRAEALLRRLGLDVVAEAANDPFFGRSGRLLAASQRAQELKIEIVTRITAETPTAIASFNQHQSHFALAHGITLPDGSPAHTACLGFGLERIVLALLSTHGLDPRSWPDGVRDALWG